MKRIALLAALALVVLGVFAVRLVLDLNSGADTFYPGVSVDGLKLNGYTMEEAREKLSSSSCGGGAQSQTPTISPQHPQTP